MDTITIRNAALTDAERIAELANELGYPTVPGQMRERLRRLLRTDGHVVMVAEEAGEVLGWMHVRLRPQLTSSDLAEVDGLIVASQHRGRGIGERLLRAAEAWSAERGCRQLMICSNATREDAANFYARVGYRHLKVWRVFIGDLAGPKP